MLTRFTYILAVIGFCLLSNSATAQTTTTEGAAGTQGNLSSNVFGVGLAGSLCSGMGIAFRQHFAGVPLAYQVTGGVFKTQDNSLWDLGAEVQYDLTLSDNRLYALLGGGYYHSGKNSNELEAPQRFGAGIGYEAAYSKNIGAYVNLMITLYEPKGDILPLPSAGILIYFK